MLKLNYYTCKTIFYHESRNGRIIKTQQYMLVIHLLDYAVSGITYLILLLKKMCGVTVLKNLYVRS